MLELGGSFGRPKMICLMNSSFISTTLGLISLPSPSISPKVRIYKCIYGLIHSLPFTFYDQKLIRFASFTFVGSSQVIAQYYQLIRLGYEVSFALPINVKTWHILLDVNNFQLVRPDIYY